VWLWRYVGRSFLSLQHFSVYCNADSASPQKCSGQRPGVVLRKAARHAHREADLPAAVCDLGSLATEFASLRTTSVSLPARPPVLGDEPPTDAGITGVADAWLTSFHAGRL
jgi:hypothetical protein